jgi:hypothetical protein
MLNLQDMSADLRALHDTIDREAPVQEIRIAVLCAITRHRFFTEEMMKAMGD